MKFSVCFLAIIACIIGESSCRRYYAEEDDINSRRFITVENENGEIERIDVLSEPVEYTADVTDLTYYLYTKKNADIPYKVTNFEADKLRLSHFDPTKNTYFITHGWKNNWKSVINEMLQPALTDTMDVNVFVVDWSKPANKNYITAAYATGPIGKFMGAFINAVAKTFRMSSDKFILIGHSLGAHVSGIAGKNTDKKVEHIIGLDPASPLFTVKNKKARLAVGDALYVQVIHTNGGYLGFSSSLGDGDYFPNGGTAQPGCGLDLTSICAHSRAYIYMTEAIRSNKFVSRICDTYKRYKSGSCSLARKSLMGQLIYDVRNDGDSFLTTNPKDPYGRGE